MFKFVLLAALVAVASAGVLGPIREIGQRPIVGGSEASIQDAPWQVALEYNGGIRCGGSIITPTAILTSGQCTIASTPSPWNVRVGSSQHATGGTSHKVSRVVTHPQFSFSPYDYDIAILILAEAITIDDVNTKIIHLPELNLDVPVGSTGLVTGWGSVVAGGNLQRNLYKVTLPIIDQSTCVSAYLDFNPVNDRMICGGLYGVGGVGFCQGDVGGPLIVDGILVGVTSWTKGCGDPLSPGVWTRVPALVGWVLQQI